MGGATYTPAARSTSGLGVTFTVAKASVSVCSISAGVVSFTGPGTCVIDADQAGNSTYAPAAEAQQSFGVVNAAPPPPGQIVTDTSLSASAVSVAAGGSVAYTATVTPVPGGGTVAFYDNASLVPACGAQPVDPSSGAATCSVAYPSPGSHTVTAAYSGYGSYAASTSAGLTETVTVVPLVATSTVVSVSPASVLAGSPVAYSARVASESGTPGGSVQFATGSTILCPATLSGGVAACSASDAPVGTDTVTATYSGDVTHAGSAGSAVLVVAAAPGGGGYRLVGSDGGVFSFGDAAFDGSVPDVGAHVSDIVAVAATPDGGGYWLVGSDGGGVQFR